VATQINDAERQARREADRQRTRDAVEALRTSTGWRQWLSLRRHFHRYSLANQLLIAVQKPEATRVAGFRTWLTLGYCVRRGERAIRIWIPIPPSKRAIERWEAEGAKADKRPRTTFRLGPVFDRSQVAPLPPPAEPVALDPPMAPLEGAELMWAFQPLVALAGQLSCAVVIERMPDARGGYFEPISRKIALNESNSVNHQVKTLVHELSHALMRVEIELNGVEFTYSEEELVVESVAYTVCGSLGLDTSGYSIPYLASWAEAADIETIEHAAGVIESLARRVETAVGDDRGQRDAIAA
jgi:antirestriction protein ArdC